MENDVICVYPQGRGDAEQLYKELEEMVNCIRSLLGQLRSVMDQLGSGNPDAHRSNLQQVQLTSSASEKLLELLTEKEDEIRALKEEHSKRLQEMRQLEDEKQNQNEQAKLVEIEYHVEMEQNEKLRAENDTLKDQLDSGLVASLDEEDEDIDVLKRKVSGLKARVKDQNDDINKLRDHSKEQSRQVLKYKQQVEVSEVSVWLHAHVASL